MYSCSSCGLGFKNVSHLNKHKFSFCVGAVPTDRSREQFSTADQLMQRNKEMHQANRAIEQLKDLKQRRALQRDFRDIEDKLVVTDVDDRSSMPTRHGESRGTVRSFQTESSMSIQMDQDSPRKQSRNSYADHGKGSRRGGRQKQERSLSTMIRDLQRLEVKNAHAIEDLKRLTMSRSELPPVRTQTPVRRILLPVLPNPYPAGSVAGEIRSIRDNYLRMGGGDPIILAQITEMEAEARLVETKKEMQRPPSYPQLSRDPLIPQPTLYAGKRGQDAQQKLFMFEVENERIRQELDHLRGRNQVQAKKKEVEDEYMEDFSRQQLQHERKLFELQQDIELAKHEAVLNRYKREANEARQHPDFKSFRDDRTTSSLYTPIRGRVNQDAYQVQPKAPFYPVNLEPLPIAPYDPMAGFSIFYDFIVGLEPGTTTSRLVVCLHSNLTEMSEPSILPTVTCREVHDGLKVASLGAKQPVPRCSPSNELTMVIELQTTSAALVSDRMMSKAWAKIDLFDDQLRLVSGKWRVPLRILPLKPEHSTAELNLIPQLGAAELYYRLVNARDADSQSVISFHPQYLPLYQFTPLTMRVSRKDPLTPIRPRQSILIPPPQPPPPRRASHVPPPPSATPPTTPGHR